MPEDNYTIESQVETLLRVINQAYWLIETGDRIGALKILSKYAKYVEQKDHWITKK